jgi:hypothetical protein
MVGPQNQRLLALKPRLVNDFSRTLALVNDFSTSVNVSTKNAAPVTLQIAGYQVLESRYSLRLPAPLWRFAAIGRSDRRESRADALLLPRRYGPPDTLAGHLEFALKWEGIELPLLKQLFKIVPREELRAIILAKPSGVHTRRLWFLYEWLMGETLDLPDSGKIRAVPVVDTDLQFALVKGALSSRHSVLNNLPGTSTFCPLVRRTAVLDHYIGKQLQQRAREVLGRTHPDIVTRAAAFLLLSDSRASFNIEGEQPSQDRALRWAQTIGEAGTLQLNAETLEGLQEKVISDWRFVIPGLRHLGGFIGIHDRVTRLPIPSHISARPQDLDSLISGVTAYDERTLSTGMDPVIAAASIAFGFVYIHPFEDGNGRVHRWLIHHVLSRAGYNPPTTVFPVSAVMLREISEYKRVLESYTRPLLRLIEWHPTQDNNVEVVNDTADYYRYFDATLHAEFLYHCVETTVEHDLPEEVAYLESYDRFVRGVQEIVDMPASTLDLLHRFLHQNGGLLSKRARAKEFQKLRDQEVERIERLYRESHDLPDSPPPRGQ